MDLWEIKAVNVLWIPSGAVKNVPAYPQTCLQAGNKEKLPLKCHAELVEASRGISFNPMLAAALLMSTIGHQ